MSAEQNGKIADEALRRARARRQEQARADWRTEQLLVLARSTLDAQARADSGDFFL